MEKVTQAGLALSLYTADIDITHEAFVAKFLEVFPEQSAKIAALYWQNKARRAKFGLAAVKLPEMYKDEPKAEKAPKPAKVKAEKAPKVKVAKAPKPAKPAKTSKSQKSPEEQAAAKAANLQRMKDITAKYGSRVARPEGSGVDGFDATAARAEVDNILADDSFAAPEFLSKDQVRALV